MFTNREDLAWVAGFFDGEGSFSLRKQCGKYSARMAVAQVDPEVLEKCRRVTGLGKVYGPYQFKSRAGSKCQPIYIWQATAFESVQALLAMLWAWLGTKKREQARRVLQLHGKIHD